MKIIRSLNPYKACGHNEIFIRVIRTCVYLISKPLAILSQNCFENECFLKKWKKGNIVLLHKKNK